MNRMDNTAEEVAPEAASLVESLRDFGYTLPSALADLIDNSLTAGAKRIDIKLEAAGGNSHIAVVDDGSGMDQPTLVEAMRMGTTSPITARADADLGRFGLGLKTASLSQGRCVTVVSKIAASGAPMVRRWDIGHIKRTGRWQLLQSATTVAQRYVDQIAGMSSGTAVIIEDLDRASFLQVGDDQLDDHLGGTLDTLRQHLSMVFHRFIEDGVAIRLGPNALRPWDPFIVDMSTRLAPENLKVGGETVRVTPFVLPHHSRLTDEQHVRAAGPNGWNAHQGFYIYRCRRLIVPGSWLNLSLRKDEHCKLARIQVDLPNSVDTEWQLNVMKSHVSAPAYLRDDFRRIAAAVRGEAAKIYRFRGERVAPQKAPPQRYLWRREETRTGVRYRIDRTHPVVRALLHAGCGHDKELGSLLDLIETSVPIASMLQEPAKAVDGSVVPDEAVDLEALVEALVHAEQFIIRAGRSPDEARKKVLSAEPFVHYRDSLLERLGATV